MSDELWHGKMYYEYYPSDADEPMEGCVTLVNPDEFYNTPVTVEDDIWKKFELLPTPPRSPTREAEDDLDKILHFTAAEKLTIVSELLDLEPTLPTNPWPGKLIGGVNKVDLRHDCMWSGRCADHKRACSSLMPSWTDASPESFPEPRPCSPVGSPVPLVSPLFASPSVVIDVSPSPPPTIAPSPTTEPAAALLPPYTPLRDHSYHQVPSPPLRPTLAADELAALRTSFFSSAGNRANLPLGPLGGGATVAIVNAADSRTIKINEVSEETPSDSESDEIDVVTVPIKFNQPVCLEDSLSYSVGSTDSKAYLSSSSSCSSSSSSPAPVAKTKLGRRPKRAVSPLLINYDKHSKKIKQEPCSRWSDDSNIFVAPSVSESKVIGRKGTNSGHSVKEPKKYRRFKKARKFSNSRSSSDSEDCEKRSQHNSMERKRRDDLRGHFQNLREHLPDLKDNPKAPKVMILNKATVYVHHLQKNESALVRTKEHERALRKRNEQKLARLLKELQAQK